MLDTKDALEDNHLVYCFFLWIVGDTLLGYDIIAPVVPEPEIYALCAMCNTISRADVGLSSIYMTASSQCKQMHVPTQYFSVVYGRSSWKKTPLGHVLQIRSSNARGFEVAVPEAGVEHRNERMDG